MRSQELLIFCFLLSACLVSSELSSKTDETDQNIRNIISKRDTSDLLKNEGFDGEKKEGEQMLNKEDFVQRVQELMEHNTGLLGDEMDAEKRRHFLGKRDGSADVELSGDKRGRPLFIGKRGPHYFIGKRRPSFIGKRRPSFIGKRRPFFIGKRDDGDNDQFESMNDGNDLAQILDKIMAQTADESRLDNEIDLDDVEKRRRNFLGKRRHFLGRR